MRHVLVTNDFPPKVGGIQSYLFELWRRLPADEVAVLTTPHRGSAAFDSEQSFRVVRDPRPVLLPTPGLRHRVHRLVEEIDAEAVVIDPALPLGLVGPKLDRPYAVVLHGAETSVPARLPAARRVLASLLGGASLVIAASAFAEAEARRLMGEALPATVLVPPGVDPDRFRPLSPEQRTKARADLGLDPHGRLVVSVSRLVPRKGMDVLVAAAARLAPSYPDLTVAIAGDGRDRSRLERLVARQRAPVRLLGAVPDEALPAVYGCADLFAMPCRQRWGGLDQEGFGIVFMEAAACGVAQVAGASGGAGDAVAHGTTGLVVAEPRRPDRVAAAIDRLLADPDLRQRMGRAGRQRAESDFSYDALAPRLRRALGQIRA